MEEILIECSPGVSGDMLLGAFYDLGVPKNIIEQPLSCLGLKKLYFLNFRESQNCSIRGELVYVNTQKKEIVIKICSTPPSNKLKNSIFKIIIEGEISLQFLNNFVSLDVLRDGNTLRMDKYEIIEKIKSKNV